MAAVKALQRATALDAKEAVGLRLAFTKAHYRLWRAYSHTWQPELASEEIEMQQQCSQQEKAETNARLKEVTIFLTASH